MKSLIGTARYICRLFASASPAEPQSTADNCKKAEAIWSWGLGEGDGLKVGVAGWQKMKSSLITISAFAILLLCGCGAKSYSSYEGYARDRGMELQAQVEPGRNELVGSTPCQWMIWRREDGSVVQDLACSNGSGGVRIERTK